MIRDIHDIILLLIGFGGLCYLEYLLLRWTWRSLFRKPQVKTFTIIHHERKQP